MAKRLKRPRDSLVAARHPGNGGRQSKTLWTMDAHRQAIIRRCSVRHLRQTGRVAQAARYDPTHPGD
jgi:hypothetical protein